ncbi:hypothetical protein EUGRSUZ_F03087 [Eucalyptus grandis]|uniref:Uncharacterized protein n=2 Tax=Eucalyptus grandis TaxID=71139 RepID=A0ACC3KKB0_EUCGR|nr:hypothetical protein EUGRSUZ_F03087 [Eucalyptus grandis]
MSQSMRFDHVWRVDSTCLFCYEMTASCESMMTFGGRSAWLVRRAVRIGCLVEDTVVRSTIPCNSVDARSCRVILEVPSMPT